MYKIADRKVLKTYKLIESVWILDKKSGICIFEENLSEDDINTNISADLASAFLSAISIFVDETFSDGIQSIEFQKRMLFFRFTEKLLYVFVFSKSARISKREKERMMNEIIHNFNIRFKDILSQDKGLGHISQFKVFSDDLKEIMRVKSPIEHLVNFLSLPKRELIKLINS